MIFDRGAWSRIEKGWKFIAQEIVDLGFAGGLGAGSGLPEKLDDLVGLEVDSFDGVIGAAAFDGGPVDDGSGGGATGVAKIGLLIDFVGAGTGLTIGKELGWGETGALGAIDDVDQAKFDGIGHGNVVVEVPGAVGILGIFGF